MLAVNAYSLFDRRRASQMGSFPGLTLWDNTTKAPENTPADPTPAIARPAISITELEAAPQTAEPISKRLMASRSVALVENKV